MQTTNRDKNFTPNRFNFQKDAIKANPIGQMHIINCDMKTIHSTSGNCSLADYGTQSINFLLI
jgi:hypothetical protein